MNNKKIYTIVSSVLFMSASVIAQEKEANLGTETVEVVRAYDATISDAFKIKETPDLEGDTDNKKKEVIYRINSFPVASTFIPEKGKAAEVEKGSQLKAFNNYILFGAGNYTNLNGELFLSGQLDESSYVAGFLSHFSTQGGVSGLLLDDDYSKTEGALIYGGQKQNFGWNAKVGGMYQTANWYGLPLDILDTEITKETLAKINPLHKYNNIYAEAGFEFRNIPFTNLDIHYNHFGDDFSTSENRFWVKPKIKTAFGTNVAQLGLVLDYVGTTYKNTGLTTGNMEFTHLNLGVEPSVVLRDEDYSVQLGVGVYYNNGKVAGKTENNIYIYPQVKASYDLVKNIVIAYAGLEGGLKQNSYHSFVEQNPFVSPDLLVAPTDQKYNGYVGMKGKLDHMISYNIKASYTEERDKPLFMLNAWNSVTALKPYQYANSFGVGYYDLRTLNLFGELRFDFEENVSMSIYGEYNNYSTDAEEAWNLPDIKAGADFKFDITDQWFAGVDLYYVGKRKDWYENADLMQSKIVNVKSYADFNLKVGYRPTKNWTVFVKGNNLLNDQYSQWSNFDVQGIQVLGGAMYKFDF